MSSLKTGRRPGKRLSRKGSSPPGESTATGPGKTTSTKFGAVKVYASFLSQAVEFKTYVVTNQTSASDLVTIVLGSYKVVCEHHSLFRLVLEKVTKKSAGGSSTPTFTPLNDEDKPLEFQDHHARSNTRFSLQLCPGAGIITVHDKILQPPSKVSPSSRSVFLTERATCLDLLNMLRKAHKVTEDMSNFTLHQVEANSRDSRELCLDHKPLEIQEGWLDPYENYFEVRPASSFDINKMRRTHSLGSLQESKPHHRVLNYRAIKKSLIPRKTWGNGYVSNDDTASEIYHPGRPEQLVLDEDKDRNLERKGSTVAKLRDSLSKLREHLDSLQRRRSKSITTDSEVKSALNGIAGFPPLKKKSLSQSELPTTFNFLDTDQHLDQELLDPAAFMPVIDVNAAESDNIPAQEVHVNSKMDYDTGDTSMNESDAGSTSFRGTNDSAYASDRTSYSSQHRRRRRGSYVDSEQSSPETDRNHLRKSQSLLELEMTPPDIKTKPSRIKSASHAQNKARLRRRPADMTGSEDQLHVWSKHSEPSRGGGQVGEVIRRTRSMQINVSGEGNSSYRFVRSTSASSKGRPTSADSVKSSVSTASRTSSGKRRALPKVPTKEVDMEEKLKRMSQEAIKRVSNRRSSKDNSQKRQEHSGKHAQSSENGSNSMHRGSKQSERHTPRMTPLGLQDKTLKIHHPDDHGASSDESEFVNEIQLDSRGPTPLRTNLEEYFGELSNDNTTPSYQNISNSHISSDYGSADPNLMPYPSPQNFTSRPYSHQHHAVQSPGSQGQNSQAALQRIIDDLKDAANKPFENSSGSHSSSESSLSRDAPRDYAYDYQQLAQWGVLEPSHDELRASGAQYVMPKKPKAKSAVDHSELKVTHPSLAKLLKSSELVAFTVDRSPEDHSRRFGIEVFESVYSESESRQKGRRPIFRSPSGRRPVIGRRKSAFVPVSTGSTESGNAIQSLPAIDVIDDHGPAFGKGLQEGDYIVEVNGVTVMEFTPERVRTEIARAGDKLELVVARPKPLDPGDKTNGKGGNLSNYEMKKEFEKLKLKYSSVKHDAEKNRDTIAELKLELQERDERIMDIEKEFTEKHERLQSYENDFRKKEEEISEWKYEANHRNIELARLTFENTQQEDRITQLRRLLIQQTELLHIQGQGYHNNPPDLDQFEEHVSAV